MSRLDPNKLHVSFSTGTNPEKLVLPRRYTLTHSDTTGELFLTIGNEYDKKQISRLYTRLMRDEVLADLAKSGDYVALNVYCHVSGGIVIGTASWRFSIFRSELPLVLEAIRYGDRSLFEHDKQLDNVQVKIYFQSTNKRYHNVEQWGTLSNYSI